MDSKQLARSLQTAAKKFNYDIKLTHAQEIIAIMSGFENRHALFKSEEKELAVKKTEVKIEIVDDEYHEENFNLFAMYDYERYYSILIPNSAGRGFVLCKMVGQTNQVIFKPDASNFIYSAVNDGFRGFNQEEKDYSMTEFYEKYKNSTLEITKEEYEYLQTLGSNSTMADYLDMMVQ